MNEVLGMYHDRHKKKYVVHKDDGTNDIEPIAEFDTVKEGLKFMHNHELPIGSIDYWIWESEKSA